jgi:diguanylate cyclase (GGDEF)-like protein
MAMLLVDIDHFKAVNDTYGHEAGDIVLQRIVAEARTEIRATDVLGRIGGEEFALVLPTAQGFEAGAAMAERIRARLERLAIPFGSAIDVKAMLRAADGALYRAKSEGRNRVILASVKEKPLAS